MVKNKTRIINFIEGNQKDIRLKDLVEKKKVLKNGDVNLLFYYGFVFKNEFYLTEKILKILFKYDVKKRKMELKK